LEASRPIVRHHTTVGHTCRRTCARIVRVNCCITSRTRWIRGNWRISKSTAHLLSAANF
jgi:hypothetical protein